MNNAAVRNILRKMKTASNEEIAGMLYMYGSGGGTYNMSLLQETVLREVTRRLKGKPPDDYIDNLLVELEAMEERRKKKATR